MLNNWNLKIISEFPTYMDNSNHNSHETLSQTPISDITTDCLSVLNSHSKTLSKPTSVDKLYPIVITLGGISASGKTTLSILLEKYFRFLGLQVVVLHQDRFWVRKIHAVKLKHKLATPNKYYRFWDNPQHIDSIRFHNYFNSILNSDKTPDIVICEGHQLLGFSRFIQSDTDSKIPPHKFGIGIFLQCTGDIAWKRRFSRKRFQEYEEYFYECAIPVHNLLHSSLMDNKLSNSTVLPKSKVKASQMKFKLPDIPYFLPFPKSEYVETLTEYCTIDCNRVSWSVLPISILNSDKNSPIALFLASVEIIQFQLNTPPITLPFAPEKVSLLLSKMQLYPPESVIHHLTTFLNRNRSPSPNSPFLSENQ